MLEPMAGRPTAIHISRLTMARDWSMADHAHPASHELICMVKGAFETRIAGEALTTRAGWVKHHPRGVGHAERALLGAELLCLTWDDGGAIDVGSWPRHVEDRTGRIRALMEWMLELSPPLDAASTSARDALMEAVAYAYGAGGARPQDELVPRLRAWVRERIASRITLDDLARTAKMSRFHFARAFAAAAGMPPMRFVRELRVDAARALLLNTDLPLREIAPRVGLGDEFQLSRVFRRVTGAPPASMRPRR